MNLSIRKFLFINLLLTLSVVTLIIVMGDYYSDQRKLELHSDNVLSQSALTTQALLESHFDRDALATRQQQLNHIPLSFYPPYNNYVNEGIQFQLWDKNGVLLLHSAQAPRVPLSKGNLGFSTQTIGNNTWRIFAIYDAKLDSLLELAESREAQHTLLRMIAIDNFYILLWTYPLCGSLIWLIVGRGLRSLRKVTQEVASRNPNNLEPVDAARFPMEITPLAVELNKLFARLNHMIMREQRFASDAAHELRTPLAALRTQTQVALNTKDEKELRETLRNILTCVDRSTHVVQQLLTLSRLSPTGTTTDDSKPLDLGKLAAELMTQLVIPAIEKNIDIALHSDDDVIILANTTAISILMRNLIDNAIRYTPEHGKILVDVYAQREDAVFRVTDDGPGIATELHERVFERFYRVIGTQATGSGLGLSIVQQIASLYQGKITLNKPKLSRGLEIEVRFPRTLS